MSHRKYTKEISMHKEYPGSVIMLHPNLEPYIVQGCSCVDERGGPLPVFKTTSTLHTIREEIVEWYVAEEHKARGGFRKYDHAIFGIHGGMIRGGMGGFMGSVDRQTGFGFILEYPGGEKVRYVMLGSALDALCPDTKMECQTALLWQKNAPPRPDFATLYRLKYGKYPALVEE